MNEDLLREIPLFASFSRADLHSLAGLLEERTLKPGRYLMREGAVDHCLYILLDGEVEVIKALGTPGERILARRGQGSIFGEMSMFTTLGEHTASVRAYTPLKLLKIRRRKFVALLKRYPPLTLELVRLLSRRLEESENLTILELLKKNRQLSQAYEELKAAQLQIIEKEKLEHEMSLARQIQLDILPRSLPTLPGLEFGALMVPARAVGGDFYDIVPLDDDRMGIVIGDVSDKGMPAALYMSLTFSLLKSEARRHSSPEAALQAVNRLLIELDISNMFVTVLYGIYRRSKREFSYVRGGHPTPIIVDPNGKSTAVPAGLGQPLGILEDPVLDQNCISLPPGSGLFIFSDGLTEALNPQGEQFGEEGAIAALDALNGASAQQVCEHLHRAVSDFSAPQNAQDDVTLVCMRLA